MALEDKKAQNLLSERPEGESGLSKRAVTGRSGNITSVSEEEETAGKILTFLRHELYMDLRYMEPALTALAYRNMEGLLTFATDGIFLYYAVEPLFRVFRKNTAFLERAYLHTVLHCVFRHLWLSGRRDRRLWNISCDIASEMVIDALEKPCTKRILSWLRIHTYDALKKETGKSSAAVIYRWLQENRKRRSQALKKNFIRTITDSGRRRRKRISRFLCRQCRIGIKRPDRWHWNKAAEETNGKKGKRVFGRRCRRRRIEEITGIF